MIADRDFVFVLRYEEDPSGEEGHRALHPEKHASAPTLRGEEREVVPRVDAGCAGDERRDPPEDAGFAKMGVNDVGANPSDPLQDTDERSTVVAKRHHRASKGDVMNRQAELAKLRHEALRVVVALAGTEEYGLHALGASSHHQWSYELEGREGIGHDLQDDESFLGHAITPWRGGKKSASRPAPQASMIVAS